MVQQVRPRVAGWVKRVALFLLFLWLVEAVIGMSGWLVFLGLLGLWLAARRRRSRSYRYRTSNVGGR